MSITLKVKSHLISEDTFVKLSKKQIYFLLSMYIREHLVLFNAIIHRISKYLSGQSGEPVCDIWKKDHRLHQLHSTCWRILRLSTRKGKLYRQEMSYIYQCSTRLCMIFEVISIKKVFLNFYGKSLNYPCVIVLSCWKTLQASHGFCQSSQS